MNKDRNRIPINLHITGLTSIFRSAVISPVLDLFFESPRDRSIFHSMIFSSVSESLFLSETFVYLFIFVLLPCNFAVLSFFLYWWGSSSSTICSSFYNTNLHKLQKKVLGHSGKEVHPLYRIDEEKTTTKFIVHTVNVPLIIFLSSF